MEIQESAASSIHHYQSEEDSSVSASSGSAIDDAIETLELAISKLKELKPSIPSAPVNENRIWKAIGHIFSEASTYCGASAISAFAISILFAKAQAVVIATATAAAVGCALGTIKAVVELNLASKIER